MNVFAKKKMLEEQPFVKPTSRGQSGNLKR
jgi:hypothetical protein